MVTKKLLPYLAMGLSMYFTSCQKDVLVDDSSLQSETISSEATIDNTIETKPALWTSYVTNVNANVAGFWQGVPALYTQTTKKYPLIIFIHGIGELGTSLSKMNCCGLPQHLSKKTFPANFNVNGQNLSFITIAPQFKWRPSAADVQSVIDYAKRRWRIDASRVYVTGLSMGGGSTWDWAGVYGQNAAAIVPVCGGTAASTTLSKNIASKNLPSWALYSTKDALVPASWGSNFLKWIVQYNAALASKTKLTIWTDVDHNATWRRAFDPNTKIDGKNIYQWMLQYTRGGTSGAIPTEPATPSKPGSGNAAPVAKAGPDQSVPAAWNYLRLNASSSTDSDGWVKSFRWSQVSGTKTLTIVSPSSATTTIKGMVAGTYQFRIAVTDNSGATSYDDVVVKITGTGTSTGTVTTPSVPGPSNALTGNKPAVAVAGPDETLPVSWGYLRLNGTSSYDPDGWVKSTRWFQLTGPKTLTIVSSSSANTLVKGMIAGKYSFRVAVTDSKGTISYDDKTVTFTNN